MSDSRRPGFPLRPTLVTVVVVLIASGAGAVGVLAYRSWTKSIDAMWGQLSSEIAANTTQRTIRYLEPALPYARLTRRLSRDGQLDPDDAFATLGYFEDAMEANREFSWLSHASEDGTYVAVHRSEDGQLEGHVRVVGEDGVTEMHRYRREGVAWALVLEEMGTYDPRARPWYAAGKAARGGTWVDPFLFATTGAPGFMYVAPDARRGEIRGVWAVEYEMSYLSEFLSELRVGQHGKVFVVSHDGRVVGHPGGLTTQVVDGETGIAMAEGHEDPMLAAGWAALAGRERAAAFEKNGLLVMAEPFPSDSQIPFLVLIIVPEADFFGPVRDEAWRAGLIALLAAFIAVALGVFFANRVSGSLRAIADELGRIGRFELSDSKLDRTSLVREVNEMAEATDSMKSSLKSFGRYVPRDVVQDLLESGDEAVLGGHKQDLTILFSDIAGFTTIAETLEPDMLVDLLRDYLESMSTSIRAHDGTVDKFIGDAIMAFWGAPRPVDNHAARGCAAALAMRKTLKKLSPEWQAEGRPAFETRIGINTGSALVGNIGASERMNYTAMGDAVNLASRLEGLNKAYETHILVGDETQKAAGDGFVFRGVDWVAVKGKNRAVLIYELVGERADVPKETLEAIELYGMALERYRARAFGEAIEGFERALEVFGGRDGPCETMIARARAHVAEPPPDDWDGSHVMKEK